MFLDKTIIAEPAPADIEELTEREREAYTLLRAAVLLDQAKLNRGDEDRMMEALDNNLQLWLTLKVLVLGNEEQFTQDVRDNLLRLTRFVTEVTFRNGTAIPDSTIDTLVNINFQLAEGLLEGRNNLHRILN